MPLLRRRTNSGTTTQTAGPAGVPSQRDTQEGTKSAEAAEAERQRAAEEAERQRAAEEAERQRAEEAERQRAAEEAERQRAAEEAERQRAEEAERQRGHYGMAGTLMILSGMLTFFIGITALIRGVFFNSVATFPFYYSVRSRGITLIAIGGVAFVVGIALLIRMHWARHVATVIAVIGAVANFIFLPFYPFWSVIVLALNILIIWELERDKTSGRELARLALVPH